jgi:hypothetical protein
MRYIVSWLDLRDELFRLTTRPKKIAHVRPVKEFVVCPDFIKSNCLSGHIGESSDFGSLCLRYYQQLSK